MRVECRTLGPRDTDHELIWSAVALVAVVATALALASGMPEPQCLFKAATGWPCLTCGTTRALHALAAGNVAAAWRMNPLVITAGASWLAYAVYGAGALSGLWPRLRIELGSGEGMGLRLAGVASAVASWMFLIVDGR